MSMQNLTLAQLECFVRVVDTGSFAEAGRQLGLSTSGMSKTITRLEVSRGVRLLNRSTHSLSLTPEGEDLIGLAREAVRSIEEVDLALAAASRDGASGRVRVGAPTAFLRACLAPLMPAFRAAHPDIQLDLRGSDRMVDLAEDAVDVVLRAGPIDGIPGHFKQTLFTFPWIACASRGYLASRSEPSKPDDLADHDLIGFRNQRTGIVDPWRFRVPGGPGEAGIRWSPQPALVLDDANAVAAAAIAGAGIAWTPGWLVAEALRTGSLVILLAGWESERMMMSMIRRHKAQRLRRVDSVQTFLRENAAAFS